MADCSSEMKPSSSEQHATTLRRPRSSAGQRDHEQSTGLEDTTLNPTVPRPWHASMTAVSLRLWRQILGLNPFKGSYFGLYKSLKSPRDRLTVVGAALLAIAAGVPLPIIGVIFGKIISSFPPDEHELRLYITQLLGVAVGYFVVTSAYTTFFSRTGERIAIHLRERLLRRLLYADQAYLDVQDLDYNAILRDNIDTIQVGCSEKVGIFLQSISYFVAAFTVGFILSAKLTGILFAAVIPSMVFVVAFGSTWISKFTKLASTYTEKANATALSALRSIQVVQAYGMIEQVSKSHREHLKESSRIGLRKAIASALQLGGAFFIAYSANGLAFYVGSKMAAAGAAGGSSGTIYAVVFLILDASFVVGQFAPFLEIFARAASAYGKIQEIMDSDESTTNRLPSTADYDYDMRGKRIRFDGVSFSYPTRPSVPVLQGLELIVQPGKFNAIVGTSGGGKSTVVSLLMQLYDYAGSIRYGDWELRDLDKWRVRRQIAVLDQECILFHGTVYDNICYGLTGRDVPKSDYAARCDEAVIAAGVDFLSDLPDGIQTRIDNTQQLSGGQRQRVCLARALISRPALLVLDEPTSALDARSEMKVMSAVQQAIANGTTVLMIAHRLSTVLGVDHITVLQDGRAVEHGSPAELIAQDSIFASLLVTQKTNAEAQTPDICFDDDEKSQIFVKAPSTRKSSSQIHEMTPEVEDTAPSLRTVLAHFFRLTRSDHTIVIAGVCASIISGAMIIGEAIVFGGIVQLLNVELDQPDFQQQANFYCLMFFILACIALLAYVASGTAFGIASSRLVARVQAMLLRNVLHLDIGWFAKEGHSANELSSTFAKDASDLACLSGVALGTVFTVIVSVFGGIILAHAVAWKIAVVLLSAVPVMLASGFVRLRLLAKSERRHRTAYSDASSLAVETCQGRKTVTILGLEEFKLKRYHEALRKPYKAGLSYTVLCNTFLALSLAITYFVYALAYWWGSKQVRNGSYSQQQFFTVLPALLFSAQSAGQLFSLSPEIARAKTAAVSVFRLLSYAPTILASADSKEKSSERSLESSVESLEKPPKIEFDSVDFSYSPDSGTKVLDNVSFTVGDGETVALVGPSGAGKSSIIALFERFFDPQSGQVRFHGADLKNHDVGKLRRRMALLSQVPELFPGSIQYNIALGIPERTVSQEEIEHVAALCGMHDFISSLPEGYATECGSVANSQLSGGQRQRIALARAMLRDPEVLLLDEPTSALDAQSEKQVQDALQAAEEGRTTILVAHRLASIQHADKIVVMDGGRVVEQGTHAELVEMGGLYANMARAQSLV